MKLIFHQSDREFTKNVNEIVRTQNNHVDFITLVHNGRAVDVNCGPTFRADGWAEYNGWRHPAEEIEKVTVYFK